MTLNELLNVKNVSIYCIINEQDKKVLFVYSRSTIPSILQTIQKINEGSLCPGDKNKLVFKIIETYDNRNKLYMTWRIEELYQEFELLGYTPYNERKRPSWKLYYSIGRSSTDWSGTDYKAIVKLKTSENFIYRIKELDSVQEAIDFVQSNTISTIVRGL